MGQWWLVSLLLLLNWNTISSQPIKEDQHENQTTQLDEKQCCPCPGNAGKDSTGLGEEDALPAASENCVFTRQGDMDDCPCKLRGADSQGAPSAFFPSTLRAVQSVLKPADSKNGVKPLLAPEVDLASSVLETLREVTDEEYQEALQRDAERNAENDENVKNIVNIIIDPQHSDDAMSEASNAKETRCIPPALGRSEPVNLIQVKLPEYRQPNILKNILDLPKIDAQPLLHRNVLDMDTTVGASTIHEQIVESINKGLDGLKLKHSPTLLNLNPKNKIGIEQRTFKSSDIINVQKKNNDLDQKLNFDTSGTSKLTISPLKARKQFQNNDDTYGDNNQSPSDIQVQQKIKISPIISGEINKMKNAQTNLKNLLKLRDVELIPPSNLFDKTRTNVNVKIPEFNLKPIFHRDIKNPVLNVFYDSKPPTINDLFRNGIKFNFNNNELYHLNRESDSPAKLEKQETNVQVIPRVKTKILDTLPQASEAGPIFKKTELNNDDHCESNLHDTQMDTNKPITNEENISEQKVLPNDPVDALPSASETHSLLNQNENNVIDLNEADVCDFEIDQNSKEEIESKNLDSPVKIDHAEISTVPNGNVGNNVKNLQKEINIKNLSNEEVIIEDFLDNMDEYEDPTADSNTLYEYTQEDGPEYKTDSGIDENCHQDVEVKSLPQRLDHIVEENQQVQKIIDAPKVIVSSSTNEGELNQIEAIGENNSKTLEDFQSLNPDENFEEDHEDSNSDSTNLDCVNEDLPTTLTNSQVNIKDLQKLSNKLLTLSERKEKQLLASRNTDCNIAEVSDNINPSENPETIDTQTSPTSLNSEIINADIKQLDKSLPNNDNNNILNEENSKEEVSNINSGAATESNSCQTGMQLAIKTSPSNDHILNTQSETVPKEMSVEASAPILSSLRFDNNLRANSLHDIIVQPSSLFGGQDLNIFKRPLVDVDTLNILPTLEELPSRIANIFNIAERDSYDDDDFSLTGSESKLFSNINPVKITGNSKQNSLSARPPLKSLEDINLDVVQLKPLKAVQLDPLKPNKPKLNMNSYKAKVAIPQPLTLKPVKLKSTTSNKAGVLGASLTIQPHKLDLTNKIKDLTFKDSGRLASPIVNLPTVADLEETLKANTRDLLGASIPTLNLNVSPSEHINVLSDNLRAHTENTVKNIQQTLAALPQTRNNELNMLTNALTKPQDVFEMISRTHEDMNDKLRGLQYDFNDRLSSIHESIMERPKLSSTWSSPVVKQNKKMPQKSGPRRNKQTQTKTMLRVQNPSSLKSKINKQPPSINKSNTQSNIANKHNLKSSKIIAAARSPTFKTAATDTRPTAIKTKTLFAEPNLQRNVEKTQESLLLAAQEPSNISNTLKRQFFRNSLKPLTNTKVTISFSTTTPRPTPRSRYPLTANNKSSGSRTPLSRTVDNTNNSPIKLSSSKSTLQKSPVNTYVLNLGRSSLLNQNSNVKVPNIKSSVGTLKQKPPVIPDTATSRSVLQIPARSAADNTLLYKIREAVKARQSSNNNNNNVIGADTDMSKAPSENVETGLRVEPMKENVKYKCKMVCIHDE